MKSEKENDQTTVQDTATLGEGKWIGSRKEHRERYKSEGDVLVLKLGNGFTCLNFIIRLYNLHMLM